MAGLVYYLGVAALITHELDAVMQYEWRLLYVLRDLTDEAAYPLFVALHFPLVFGLLWLSHLPSPVWRHRVRQAVAGFLVVHALLHLRLTGPGTGAFEALYSNFWIYLAAALGIAYLVLAWRAPAVPPA